MSKIKKYTEEECELIYSNSIKKKNKLTHQELAEKLGRTAEGIRKKELELKRKALSYKRCSGWSNDDIKKLQAVLDKDNFYIADLGKVIKGKDISVIKEKALELLTTGNRNNGYNRPWTEEETEYLKRWWGIEDDTTIGIYLKRSREGLRVRAKKLGICNKKIYYTARECAGMLGITDNRFIAYIQKGYVKSRKAKTEQFIYQIKHDELIEFMEKHQDKWNSRKMKGSLFAIEQPGWFIEKCKRDNENDIDYLEPQKKWTDEEYNYLLEARAQGVSYKDIAKKLNRTINSVENKYIKRHEFERKRKEREAKKEFERIKKNDYKNLDRLNKELENEKSYILKKVYKMNARKLTEEDLELCSNLRMIGYHCKEISEMVDIGDRFLQNKLSEFKDEEYIVHVEKKDFDDNEQEQLLNYIRDNYSLYELCLMFNRKYTLIINTYKKILEDLYEETKIDTWTIEEEIKMMLLKAQGFNNRIIGQKIKRTGKSAVRSRVCVVSSRKYKPDDNREFTKDEDNLIKIYFKEDLNIDVLCSTTKRSKECILKRYEHIRGEE